MESFKRRPGALFPVFDYRRLDRNSLFQECGKAILLHRDALYYPAYYLFDSGLRVGFG